MKRSSVSCAIALAMFPTALVLAADQGKGNSTGLSIPSDGVPACVISNGKAPSKNPHCTADGDGDGTPDYLDLYPTDPTEWKDSDGDNVGDNADPFDDDPTEWADTDSDGVGNNGDKFPSDPTEWADADGDGYGNNGDVYPSDPLEWANTDGDALGNNADMCPTEFGDGIDGCPVSTEVVGTDLVSTFDVFGVASTITKILGNGTGGVFSNTTINTGQFFGADITIKDFDGDAIDDVIVLFKGDNRNCFAHSSPKISLYKNDGAGNLTAQPQIDIVNFCPTNSWAWGALASEDFNGDGKLDFAFPRAHHTTIVLANGSGGYTQQHLAGGGGRSTAAGDYDNDGDLDLVVHQANGNGGFYYYTNGGSGIFTGPTHFGGGELPIGAVAGDYNGDGNLDIATGGYTKQLGIYLGNGLGGFSSPTVYNPGPSGNAVVANDLDDDGNVDIVVVSGADLMIYFGNGSGSFVRDVYTLPHGIFDVEVVDFNEDGNKDLAVTRNANFTRVMFGDGSGAFTSFVDIPVTRAQGVIDSGNLD